MTNSPWADTPDLLKLVETFIKDHDLSPKQEEELLNLTKVYGHSVIDFCSNQKITGPQSIFVIFHLAEMSAKLIAGLTAANTQPGFGQHIAQGVSKIFTQSLTIHEAEARKIIHRDRNPESQQ